MTRFPGFRPATFQFLRDLGRNNEKVWFEASREVYEREVREPMRRLVEALDARLALIAPRVVTSSRLVDRPCCDFEVLAPHAAPSPHSMVYGSRGGLAI